MTNPLESQAQNSIQPASDEQTLKNQQVDEHQQRRFEQRRRAFYSSPLLVQVNEVLSRLQPAMAAHNLTMREKDILWFLFTRKLQYPIIQKITTYDKQTRQFVEKTTAFVDVQEARWESNATIREDIKIDERHIQRAIAKMKKSGILLANGRKGKEDRELALGPLFIATLTGTLPQPKKQKKQKKQELKKPETSTQPSTQGGEGLNRPHRGGAESAPLGIKKGDIKKLNQFNSDPSALQALGEKTELSDLSHALHGDVKNQNQEKENMDLRQSFNAIKKQADAASPPAPKKPALDPLPPIGPQDCKMPPLSERAARGRVWEVICPLAAQRPIPALIKSRMNDAIEKQRLAGNIDAIVAFIRDFTVKANLTYAMDGHLKDPERVIKRMSKLVALVDEFQP